MRFRGKSIRRKIVALLLVPLVSLTAVWGFATVLTGRDVTRMLRVSRTVEAVGHPTEATVRLLQSERRESLIYLADPRAADALTSLHRARTDTDKAVARLRAGARARDTRAAVRGEDGERLTAVLDALGGLESLRRGVEERTVTRAEALDLYNRLVDPCYALIVAVDGIDDVEMDKQAAALVNTTRARELLSREDALLASSLVVGRLTRTETRQISDLVAQRDLLYDISLPLLPAAERERYEHFWRNAATAPLRVAERNVVATDSGTPRGVTATGWKAAASGVLYELGKLDQQANDRFRDRVRPLAVGVIVQAAVVGVLGLVAVLVSLVLSVRVGRRLIRDLRQLSREAHEASGTRLPNLMRRLTTGEQVDVESEVPRREYDKNEIGEVGQALNTLQRAAVEAAVKQAELRAGVSEVFVNLARRSQVLLHKQLTLLDTMERRTEDTAELADLFRLDHLTTRMRRHAEGLVILSGAVPSRQWRRPIRLMDVVRAAIAEVEDYERIEVRRLPSIAVTGPAVSDLTHLVAELLENATVFSPPHTAVQVVGERVGNGFTLEIHDRGLGMTADTLLDANLRLAETPEFELSDTDRLGLFVVSRLARRQKVRVSLQPSPYGGTTAVVFIPDALLSDDDPGTNGLGIRLDPARLTKSPAPPLPAPPAEPSDPDDFPGALQDTETERGAIFRPRGYVPTPDPDPEPALPSRTPPPLPTRHRKPRDTEEDGAPGTTDTADASGSSRPTGPSRRTDGADPADFAGRSGLPNARGSADPSGRMDRDGSADASRRTDLTDPDGSARLSDRAGSPGQVGPADPADPSVFSGGTEPFGSDAFRGPAGLSGPVAPTGFPDPMGVLGPDGPTYPADSSPFTGRTGFTDPWDLPTPADPTRPGDPPRSTGPARSTDPTRPADPTGFPDPTDVLGPAPATGSAWSRDTSGLSDPTGVDGPTTPPGQADTPESPRPVTPWTSPSQDLPRRPRPTTAAPEDTGARESTPRTEDTPAWGAGSTSPLPRRVRQASLAPQLKQDPRRKTITQPAEPPPRDADEVRTRMAALQRGWQRGREENAAGDEARHGTAPGTTKGDGR
ncbi:nitrate- and nitrite sensing domain-containing protein [Streptomyces sp. LaPpAH-108]|uniref:sensor histidine kinase n=1 Tax=Streptomyces sp. LaPpAH-108 TaxID=1155714 RepID=UPI00056F2B09|nr:nitrate- and nitrite sensing domain-containing protein [Streptomyces sp. LaPpAH-108]